jgi:hypothetical protein
MSDTNGTPAGSIFGVAADVNATVDVEIKLPNGRPIADRNGRAFTITITGPDSKEFRDAMRREQAKRLEDAAQTRGRRLKVTKHLVDELDAGAIETLVAVTRSWYVVGSDGEPREVPCTPENRRLLYSDPTTQFIREQVQEALDDRAAFFPSSVTT